MRRLLIIPAALLLAAGFARPRRRGGARDPLAAASVLGTGFVGSALAVVLLVAIIPLMVLNVRRFQAQEAQR